MPFEKSFWAILLVYFEFRNGMTHCDAIMTKRYDTLSRA